MISSWSRYPWDNDTDWEFIWIADRKYIDSAGAVSQWIPYKSPPGLGHIWTASGAQRPTWNADWGTRNAGSIYYNGINNMMNCDILASYITGYQEFSHFFAFQLVTVGQNQNMLGFTHGSSSHSFLVFQSYNPGIGGYDRPFSFITVSDQGRYGVSFIPQNVDSNRNVWSQTFLRKPSPTNYLVESTVWNNSYAVAPNSPAVNYLVDTLTVNTCSMGGIITDVIQHVNVRVRALGFTRRNIRQGLTAIPTDSQKASCGYLVKEAV